MNYTFIIYYTKLYTFINIILYYSFIIYYTKYFTFIIFVLHWTRYNKRVFVIGGMMAN